MITNPERKNSLPERIKPGCVAAASELAVCIDLINQGWDVFRAVSPQHPFDLIAVRGMCKLEIEVRTSNTVKGRMNAGKHGRYDVLAIVRGSAVEYRPPLPIVEI